MCSNDDLRDASSPHLITLVHAALQELAGRSVAGSVAVLEDAWELGRALDIGEAALALLVAAAEASGACKQEGYPATVSWLRTDLGMTHGRASERVTLARQLPRLERTRELLSQGKLSVAYARDICGAVTRLEDADAVVAEEILLGMVESGAGVREVARAATRITELVRQRQGVEGEPEDGRRDDRRSWLRRSRSVGGGSFVKGWLSALDEATFAQIIDPLAKPAGKDDPRDSAERMADALMSVLAQGGRTGGVTVIADLGALDPDPDTSSPPHNQHHDNHPRDSSRSASGHSASEHSGNRHSDNHRHDSRKNDHRESGSGESGSRHPDSGHSDDRHSHSHSRHSDGRHSDSPYPNSGYDGSLQSGNGQSGHTGNGQSGHSRSGSGHSGNQRSADQRSGSRPSGYSGSEHSGSGHSANQHSGPRQGSNGQGGHRQGSHGQGGCGQSADPHSANGYGGNGHGGNEHTNRGQEAVPPASGRGWSAGRRTGARLLDGTPLSPAQARRVALAGGINLLLLGNGGHPLYLGRQVRCVTPAQRKVLEALYPTCAVAGCDIPAYLCEIHHLGGGWKFGTPTNIDQLVPACRFHNQWIEDHPHHITETRDDNGRTRLLIQRLHHRTRPTHHRPPEPSTPPSPTNTQPSQPSRPAQPSTPLSPANPQPSQLAQPSNPPGPTNPQPPRPSRPAQPSTPPGPTNPQSPRPFRSAKPSTPPRPTTSTRQHQPQGP